MRKNYTPSSAFLSSLPTPRHHGAPISLCGELICISTQAAIQKTAKVLSFSSNPLGLSMPHKEKSQLIHMQLPWLAALMTKQERLHEHQVYLNYYLEDRKIPNLSFFLNLFF